MKVKIYTAVCQNEKGDVFLIKDGGRSNFEDAIMAAQKHKLLRQCKSQIIRMQVEEHEHLLK